MAVALAAELVRRGHRVMTIKHGHHPADADRPGSDTWRHFNEGKAERVLIASPELRVLFERRVDNTGPEELARRYFSDMDIVLVEGFKQASIPKIEVYRKEVARAPLYDPSLPNAADWIAIVTDDHKYHAPIRVLHFTDTMWLTVLTALVMEQAKPLAP